MEAHHISYDALYLSIMFVRFIVRRGICFASLSACTRAAGCTVYVQACCFAFGVNLRAYSITSLVRLVLSVVNVQVVDFYFVLSLNHRYSIAHPCYVVKWQYDKCNNCVQ